MNNDFSAILIKNKSDYVNLEKEVLNNNTQNENELIWVNLDYNNVDNHTWLKETKKIDNSILEPLLALDTRPRYFIHEDGLLLILRAVNLNPGASVDDMVSIRVWIEKNMVITVYKRNLKAISDIKENIFNQNAPENVGEFLSLLVKRITMRMEESINNIVDLVDEIEDKVFEEKNNPEKTFVSELRGQIIRLKRYLAPQKEVLSQLHKKEIKFLNKRNQANLRESADRITRYVEDLDAAKERAAIAQDEIDSQIASHMNKTLYLLSIISVIFLPLSFITGLLGINVGGIPGSTNSFAFIFVCALLSIIAIIQILIFKHIKWV